LNNALVALNTHKIVPEPLLCGAGKKITLQKKEEVKSRVVFRLFFLPFADGI
jgi:hypothetical protein